MSQYIGNLRYEETFQFYKDSIIHLQNLLQNHNLQGIGYDLHPQYLSTEYARELKKKYDVFSHSFQHHYAHAASLLVDNQILDEHAIIVAADGLGYGQDGQIWGGEVLECDLTSMKRINHINYVHQPGGDLATKYPIRMIISYLHSAGWSNDQILNYTNNSLKDSFNFKLKENEIILHQINKNINIPLTSSTGRFLDACSVSLGLCRETSYEGEPAIILEGAGYSKRNLQSTNPFIKQSQAEDLDLNLSPIFEYLIQLIRKNHSREELAFHIQEYIGWLFAKKSLEHSENSGLYNIGFTGGVAYNEIIVNSFLRELQQSGNHRLNIMLHKLIPPGDGGISVGQAVLTASLMTKKEI